MSFTFEPGKLTEEAKTHLPDLTDLELKRRARSYDQTVSEYLRDLVCIDVHGATYDELMVKHRRMLRTAQGPSAGQVQAVAGLGGVA